MRVTAIVHQFPPDFETGTEILCLSTMQALQRRGIETCVIAADPLKSRGSPTRETSVSGIPTVFIPAAEPRQNSVYRELADEFERQALTEELLEHLSRFRPDLVHVYHLFRFGVDGLSSVARTLPTVYTATDFSLSCRYATEMLPDGTLCEGPAPDGSNCVAHHLTRPRASGLAHPDRPMTLFRQSLDLLSHGGSSRLRRNVRDLHFRRRAAALDFASSCRGVMVNSAHIRANLIRTGVSADKISIVPHRIPIRSTISHEIRRPLRIGYFGSLAPHKGPHLLMEAIRSIAREYECEVTVCGSFSGDAAYLRQLRQLASADARIHLKDRVPFERFEETLAEVDVVVVPSIWPENTPLVLLTALALKRYVIASDMPGLTDVLQPIANKAIVPANDVASLAAALKRVIQDPTPVQLARTETAAAETFDEYVNLVQDVYAAALAPANQL